MGEIGKEVGESYVGMSRGKMKVKGKLKVREVKEVKMYYVCGGGGINCEGPSD
jgi:hypothetical protein